jgi:uncharacterized protein (DUF488 family)
MENEKLYTVGYGNRVPADFFHLLQSQSIQMLVDVRTTPYSRFRPQFNKNSLAKTLLAIGIEYIFKGEELGGLSLNEKTYQDTLYQQGIDFLIEKLKSGYRLAIMCCEADVRNCHRLDISDDIFKRGYKVIHIGKQGELIQHEGLQF